MALNAGQSLLHYRLVEIIGEGGMGVVWKAQDETLGRDVAIKVLPVALEQDAERQERQERFEREARLLASLNHPNVATIHGLHQASGTSFLAMELIEGRTLRAVMREGGALEESLGVALQVARALAAAHAAGIVHRDLKPENVMVRDDGYAKVLDFGLALLAQVSSPDVDATTVVTAEGAIVGTVPYMSPEQCRGARISSASDIFSLGVVLYELVTGHHPFRAHSVIDCMQRIISEPPLSPSRVNPAVSGELEAVLLEMLKKEVERRPDAGEVVRRLSERAKRSSSGASRPDQEESLPPVVGRAEQEDSLFEDLRTASSGRARLACVSGEPGVGKTTLVEGFLRRLAVEEESCYLGRGRCSERLAGTEAYLPLLEALEGLLTGPKGGQVSRVMEAVAPSWYFRTVPVSSGDAGRSGALNDARASSQERLKRELIALLQELSQTAPVVLFFDDLHWADASTVDALAYIGARQDGLRLLVVATYRPSDLLLGDHPFVGVKRDLQARSVARELALGFLSKEDVASYLDLEFPGHAFPGELADFVHARTEGNALFMVNLIGYLREVGALVEDEAWRLAKPLADLGRDVPESIRSMIERKIDQLADDDRRLLVVASVQGAEFHASVVADALGEDEAEVEERLERLDRVHALVTLLAEEELPDGSLTVRYSFVHALYQNALYRSLTPARRAARSAAVAGAWLRRRAGDHAPVANELGVLFEDARNFQQAAEFFLEAAGVAGRVHACQEAIVLTRRSLRNAERLEGDERYRHVHDAARHLALVNLTRADFEQAAASFAVAEDAAERLDDTGARIQAVCGRAMALCFLHRLDDMHAEGARAEKLARAAGSSTGLAAAETVLASQRLCVGDLASADKLFESSGPMHHGAYLKGQTLQTDGFRLALSVWRLDYGEAHRIGSVALAKARELGSTFDILAARFFLGMTLGNEGRLGEAMATLVEVRRLAELNQSSYWLSRTPNTLGWLHEQLGGQEASLALNLENIELAREFAMAEGEANAHVNVAGNYLDLSEWERAREHLRAAERVYDTDVWFRWRYNLRLRSSYARYWIARGDLEAARASAEACRQASRQHQSPKYLAVAEALLGEIAMLEDDVGSARVHLDESLRVLEGRPCPTVAWKFLRLLGELAAKTRDEDGRDLFLGRAREVVAGLARSVPDEALRKRFLESKDVREL